MKEKYEENKFFFLNANIMFSYIVTIKIMKKIYICHYDVLLNTNAILQMVLPSYALCSSVSIYAPLLSFSMDAELFTIKLWTDRLLNSIHRTSLQLFHSVSEQVSKFPLTVAWHNW